MDLIYSDRNRKEEGVLHMYLLDMAYGSDENNFECTVDSSNHCCKEGYFLHIENTEYGGVIDSIRVDTETEEIIYSGRTFHGILEGKIITPMNGNDYYVVDGEANAVIREVLLLLGLSDLFYTSEEDSGIYISDYQFERYVYGYRGIKSMLESEGAKLRFEWKKEGRILIIPEYAKDYSRDEEFDQSQIDFTIQKNYRPYNHMICLGQGELSERAVIHLFMDENGGIQPYATTDTPVKDSDYILDDRYQVLFGLEERAYVYDYPGADITTNYIALTEQPKNWEKKLTSYFRQDDDGDYKELEYESEDVYLTIESVPKNWAKKYGKYYQSSGEKYIPVRGVESVTYRKLAKRPNDFSKKFQQYYYKYSDGVTEEMRTIPGISKYRYKLQTRKPTDFEDSYLSYYRNATAQELKKDPKKKYYSLSGDAAPKWKPKTYYTKYHNLIAPKWEDGKYYRRMKATVAPEFKTGTYFEKVTEEYPVPFVAGEYFKAVEDRYAVLVENALEQLEELNQSEELRIDFQETETIYDISDIVGAREMITGISSVQKVTKKIIRIKNGDITISYEVS